MRATHGARARRAASTSAPADSSSWPVPGKKRIALTPLLCPLHVWIQRLGKKQVSLSLRRSRGGASQERPCAREAPRHAAGRGAVRVSSVRMAVCCREPAMMRV